MNTVEKEIVDLLYKMWNAYISRDMKEYEECYVKSPNLVNMGPSIDETLIGFNDFMKFVQKSANRGKGIKLTWYRVGSKGDVAWIAGLYTASAEIDGKLRNFNGKMSSVFLRNENKWQIIQSQYAFELNK